MPDRGGRPPIAVEGAHASVIGGSAAAGVVLAMPMSPVSRIFAPPPASVPATEMPTSTAARASSRVIAGPAVRSRVPPTRP